MLEFNNFNFEFALNWYKNFKPARWG